jgi:hypothetical protein
VVSVEHIGEDDSEQYAMRTLPVSACATLEEHLLICSECRDRLESTDQYVMAMKLTAAHFGCRPLVVDQPTTVPPCSTIPARKAL